MSSLAEFQMYFLMLEQEEDELLRKSDLEKKLKDTPKTVSKDGTADAYKPKDKEYRVKDVDYFARDMQ